MFHLALPDAATTSGGLDAITAEGQGSASGLGTGWAGHRGGRRGGTIRDCQFGVMEMMTPASEVRPAWPAEASTPDATAKLGAALTDLPLNVVSESGTTNVNATHVIRAHSQSRAESESSAKRHRLEVLCKGWQAFQSLTPRGLWDVGCTPAARLPGHRRRFSGPWTMPGRRGRQARHSAPGHLAILVEAGWKQRPCPPQIW